LCETIPCAQMVRLGKNGSDATSGAVRLARAYTGRDKIICCGYHGWQDWYVATTTRNLGIPRDTARLTHTFSYNKIETLEHIFKKNKGRIACVIMEPVGVEEPRGSFLKDVKNLTHKNGAILIFDEVITGFRLAPGGAQEYYRVKPDIACVGKAMGNGFSISAIAGKREIMRFFEHIFYSFTFGGEIAPIRAAIATINEIRQKRVIPFLWKQGARIREGYNRLAQYYGVSCYTECIGLAPRTAVSFKTDKGEDWLDLKSLFQQECINRGVLFTGCHNICYSHSNKEIDYTLSVYETVMKIIRDAVQKKDVKKRIKGKPVRPIFRKA